MASEPTQVTDKVASMFGDHVLVGVSGPDVFIEIQTTDGEPIVFLSAEQRDRFAKAWAEAERRAEAVSDGG